LGSAIGPVRKMVKAGAPVGLGVDGAASNDASNLLHETRAACLLARVGAEDAGVMTAREALELARWEVRGSWGPEDVGSTAVELGSLVEKVNGLAEKILSS
jgi:8-oxoguanine deaminase